MLMSSSIGSVSAAEVDVDLAVPVDRALRDQADLLRFLGEKRLSRTVVGQHRQARRREQRRRRPSAPAPPSAASTLLDQQVVGQLGQRLALQRLGMRRQQLGEELLLRALRASRSGPGPRSGPSSAAAARSGRPCAASASPWAARSSPGRAPARRKRCALSGCRRRRAARRASAPGSTPGRGSRAGTRAIASGVQRAPSAAACSAAAGAARVPCRRAASRSRRAPACPSRSARR